MTASRPAAVIILAAGAGTRMKSTLPKVLHEIRGEAMLGHVIAAARQLRPRRLIVVTGHGGAQVGAYLREHAADAAVVVQDHQGGTGHAVRMVLEATGIIEGTVIVTYGDTPLLRGATLAAMAAAHEAAGAAVTVLTAVTPEPAGYGRIVRDAAGNFAAIVEEADATAEQRAITEVNSGMYAFDGASLADMIKRVGSGNAKGEEYLTSVAGIARDEGHLVATVACADFDEVRGVNDQAQLAGARDIMDRRCQGYAREM